MSEALAAEASSRLHDGYRAALRAAGILLLTMEGEAATTAGRSALAAARSRIAALPPPPEDAIPPRDAALLSALRSALALLRAQHVDHAVMVIEGAIE